jgi:glycosyltransferase involved in cell wall biosynthesis
VKSRKKVYIIYFDYKNTSGNHAGMAYLAHQLKKKIDLRVVLLKTPENINRWPVFMQKLWRTYVTIILVSTSKKNDVVFFMEYLTNASGWQTEIAFRIREKKLPLKLIGLVHLPGASLSEIYRSDDYIKKSAGVLDKIVVFGNTLKKYFADLGFNEKVLQTFHYVDTDYYKPSIEKHYNECLRVIFMGSLKRDYGKLAEIIKECPEVDFMICLGHSNPEINFSVFKNVTTYKFLTEDNLLSLMQRSDSSLSIFNDTIGSNVITTSLATGLVNIASDVGSIRDYLSEDNSYLCKTVQEFICAIKLLRIDENTLYKKKELSINRSKNFTLEEFIKCAERFL